MFCTYCYSNEFHRSRIRPWDLPLLLLLLRPVRCKLCGKRKYIFWPTLRNA